MELQEQALKAVALTSGSAHEWPVSQRCNDRSTGTLCPPPLREHCKYRRPGWVSVVEGYGLARWQSGEERAQIRLSHWQRIVTSTDVHNIFREILRRIRAQGAVISHAVAASCAANRLNSTFDFSTAQKFAHVNS